MSALHSFWLARMMAQRASGLSAVAEGPWPDDCYAEPDDVVVDGVSTVDAARRHGTPWLRSSTRPTVAVVTVTSIDRAASRVEVDLEVADVSAATQAARLIGRLSIARTRDLTIMGPSGRGAGAARLPSDLRVGDLVAFPMRSTGVPA